MTKILHKSKLIIILMVFFSFPLLAQESSSGNANTLTTLLSVLEYVVVVLVVSIQFWFFRETYLKIKLFTDTIPQVSKFKLRQISLLTVDLKNVSTFDLLKNIENYRRRAEIEHIDLNKEYENLIAEYFKTKVEKSPQTLAKAEMIKRYGNNWFKTLDKHDITLLEIDGDTTPVLKTIIESINTYLIRNKGAVADFNLLKDIIQRNLDTIEEEISIMIPLPVYLGLMGTMAGIIVGLFGLPDVSDPQFLEGGGINGLIGGVKIAMIASLCGLLFTVYNSGFRFKGAKHLVESNKNSFFTFLQTELLPVLTENVNSGIIGLNRTIDNFGVTFGANVVRLDRLMENVQSMTQQNFDAMVTQQTALDSLHKLDISKIANVNVKVLGELNRSVGALEGLARSLEMLDKFVENSRELIDKTNDVSLLAQRIESVFEESKSLQKYLHGHFGELEKRGDIITNTLIKVDDLLVTNIKGLEQHIYERIEAVKSIKLEQEDLMRKSFYEKEDILGKLVYLEPLKDESIKYYKNDFDTQKNILNGLNAINSSLKENNKLISQLLNRNFDSSFVSKIKTLFGKKEE